MKSLMMLILALLLSAPEAAAQRRKKDRQEEPTVDPWTFIAGEHDKNGDGKVTLREYSRGKERFERLDKDRDGKLTSTDFLAGENGRKSGRGRNRVRGRRQRKIDRFTNARAPKPGDVAPDFNLKPADSKKRVRLSSFRRKKPVALIFGSYT